MIVRMTGVLPQPKQAIAAERSAPLLEVGNLCTEIRTPRGNLPALSGVSFSVARGQTLALVGETGSGKSMTALSLLGLLPPPVHVVGGSIRLRSEKVGELDVAKLNANAEVFYRIRGGVIGLVSQEPLSALSPVHTIGDQISEVVRLHQSVSRAEAKKRSIELLARVSLPRPDELYDRYPHQLSGGMRQRAVIAIALAGEPELVIADEPTTALDATTQAEVLGLLKRVQQESGCALLLITHDMGVVARMADEVAVMYYGRVVERGAARDVLNAPLHPYSRGLLRSLPAVDADGRFFAIPGAAPSLFDPPSGCAFHPRCAQARSGGCDRGAHPALREIKSRRYAACDRAEELAR